MKIENLVKNLDPVTIIEFKNYVVENLSEICKTKNSNSKIISNHKDGETICKNCSQSMMFSLILMHTVIFNNCRDFHLI